MPPLGVGLVYNRAVPGFLAAYPHAVDYLAVSPETFWTDARTGTGAERFTENAAAVADLDGFARRYPLVAHGLALSIGTAGRFDAEHLAQVARWYRRYGFGWYSEHLSYTRVESPDGGERHPGVALPVPYDRPVLDLVRERVAVVREQVDVPFALENGVTYAPMPDEDMTEPAFLNALDGAHVLLDLHNLHTNVVNGFADAAAYLAELDLDRVLEIHVASGNEIGGMYVDAHSGACPDAVWALLDDVLPRCPNVRGVAFEFVAGYYEPLGADGVAAQLDRIRAAWGRR